MKILDETMIETWNNVLNENIAGGKNDDMYYAIVDCKDHDGDNVFHIADGASYDEAAENLWRTLCDVGYNFDECPIILLHGNQGCETDALYGYMHYIFDHGRFTLQSMLATEFLYSIGISVDKITINEK